MLVSSSKINFDQDDLKDRVESQKDLFEIMQTVFGDRDRDKLNKEDLLK